MVAPIPDRQGQRPDSVPAPVLWTRRNPDRLAVLAMVVAAVLLVALHVRIYAEISPIDELSHFDLLEKTSRFELVRVEDRVGQAAMREEACRGLDRDDVLPPCRSASFDPQFFQEYGENSVARKFPIYYLLTGLPARFLRWATPIGSLVTAARLLNFVWLGAGLLVTWALMAELGVRRRARTVGLVLLATTPVVLHTFGIVNSDATLLLSGAALALLALRWERGAAPLAMLVGVAVVALVAEPSNLVAIGLVSAYLGLRALVRHAGQTAGSARLRSRGRRLLAAGALGLLALAGPEASVKVHEHFIGATRVPLPPPLPEAVAVQHVASEVHRGPVSADEVLGEVDALVTPVKRPYVPRFLSGAGTTLAVTVFNWLLLGAALACVFYTPRGARLAPLGLAALAALVSTGPIHALTNADRDVFFVTPARFGLAALPVLTALLSASLEKPSVLAGTGALAALAAGNALWHLV